MDKELEKALEYASDSISIEDLNLTEEEKEKIKDMIARGASDGSFLYSIVKDLETKQEDDKDGKTRK